MTTTSLTLRDTRAYYLSLAFVAGNILLPQMCHLVPRGGLILLPIYFFTLIAAYRYGLATGLMTAIASPLVNHMLFGMPPAAVLPILLIKSSLLAVAAAVVAGKVRDVKLWALALTVIAYQAVGMVFEGLMTGSASAALQDLTLGWPGMLLQILGGYAVLKWLARL